MSSLLNEEARSAANEWLQRLESQIATRGRSLADSGAVEGWSWEDDGLGVSAVVQGGSEYEATIPFKNGRFLRSVCTCPYASNCKHAAAAMYVALRTSGGTVKKRTKPASKSQKPVEASQSPAAQSGIVTQAGERIGKALPAEAATALARIEQWWLAKSRTLTMSDLIALTKAPNYWSREQIVMHGKHAVPESVWDYLACVDAKMSERGHKLPDPLPELIDRQRQTALMAAQRAEIAEKEWKNKIKHWASSMPGESAEADVLPCLRLRLVDAGAVIELRKPGQSEFVKASTAQLKNLPPTGNRTAGDAILSFARGQWGMVKNEFHTGDSDLPELLLQFISMPQLRNALVGSDGQPVTFHEEPLAWAIDEGSAHAYTLHLRDVHGTTPPEPLVVVLSHPSWFVTSREIWPLERWPFTHRDAGARMEIPASALETGEGVTVLRKLGLSLPERIQAKVRTVKPTVTIRAGIDQQAEGLSAYLKVTARSAYDDGSPVEVLGLNGWSSIKGEKGGTNMQGIVTYDRSALVRATAWLNTMELKHQISWRNSETWWQRRITKEFPDEFLQWMTARPEDVVVELDKELASLRDGVVSASVRLDVEEAGMDWFDLRVVLGVEDTTLTPEEIQLLLKAQGRWVRISGKGWRKLHFEMTPEQEAELAAMGLTVADFDGSPQRLHALQLAGGAEKDKSLLPAERVEEVRRRAEEIRTRVQPEVPTAITAQLRPYQLEGFHFLAYLSTNRFGGVLADDMGLGKTLQSLTWLAWLRESARGQKRKPASTLTPVLVVCPKSVQDNWRSETTRFCPSLRVVVWSRDDAGKAGLEGDADLLVIHYQQLRQHEEKLSRQRWLAVILDEAQAIKNPTSQSAKAACALQAQHRLALSGTPVENRLLDLWSILGFAMPGILGNRTHFAKHFDAKEDPLARRRLAARVRPFLLRRTKKEVVKDLPDRVEEDLVCELEGIQRSLYHAELKRARAALLNIKTSKQLDKARFNILTSLLRLRQICCHPTLVLKGGDVAGKDGGGKAVKKRGKTSSADAAIAATGSAKMDALLELLEPVMEEGGKVLVFSQFVEMLNLVQAQVVAREWPHFILTGQTEDRGALVKQFQESAGPAVFLISLKAGGFGLNLTAASYVVLCDPWWNPAVEAQAIDRTHRIGQTQKVNAYRLIVKDSIEEKIRLLQKQKSALANDILGEENFASALTLDDFRFLLGEET